MIEWYAIYHQIHICFSRLAFLFNLFYFYFWVIVIYIIVIISLNSFKYCISCNSHPPYQASKRSNICLHKSIPKSINLHSHADSTKNILSLTRWLLHIVLHGATRSFKSLAIASWLILKVHTVAFSVFSFSYPSIHLLSSHTVTSNTISLSLSFSMLQN